MVVVKGGVMRRGLGGGNGKGGDIRIDGSGLKEG